MFQPRWLTGFRISADFYRIKKQDRIVNLSTTTLLANESLMPAERITRAAPTAADTAAGRPGVITFLDLTPINSTELLTEGMDVNVGYKFALGDNRFDVSALGTFVDKYRTQLAIGQPSRRRRLALPDGQRSAETPRQRARVLGPTGFHRGCDVALFGLLPNYYVPAVDLVTGGRVASASEFDVQTSYSFSSRGRSGVFRWLDRTKVTIGASNVLDRDVPFYFTGIASTGIAGLYYSPLSDPIQRFVYMTVKKSF